MKEIPGDVKTNWQILIIYQCSNIWQVWPECHLGGLVGRHSKSCSSIALKGIASTGSDQDKKLFLHKGCKNQLRNGKPKPYISNQIPGRFGMNGGWAGRKNWSFIALD